MHKNEYKIKISEPCAFRKKVLDETLVVLKRNGASEVSVIESAFRIGGIEKPNQHNSPEGYNFYWVKCTDQEADAIVAHLFDEEASSVSASGETTPEASRYADLVDIWSQFRDWIEHGGTV